MNFLERVMRVMTHLNIGAALGLAAWVAWSGWQVVTGQINPSIRVAQAVTLASLTHGGQAVPMQLVPVGAGGAKLAPCHEPQPASRESAMPLSGEDL